MTGGRPMAFEAKKTRQNENKRFWRDLVETGFASGRKKMKNFHKRH